MNYYGDGQYGAQDDIGHPKLEARDRMEAIVARPGPRGFEPAIDFDVSFDVLGTTSPIPSAQIS
jgi:hypothetical protein